MNKEEAIKYAECLKNNYTVDLDKLPEFCDMAISALKGGWIPVEERLPDPSSEVLACDKMKDIFVAWLEDGEWTSTDKVFVKGCPILAWEPLPEPYKKGE